MNLDWELTRSHLECVREVGDGEYCDRLYAVVRKLATEGLEYSYKGVRRRVAHEFKVTKADVVVYKSREARIIFRGERAVIALDLNSQLEVEQCVVLVHEYIYLLNGKP